jgi:hypothetical protein
MKIIKPYPLSGKPVYMRSLIDRIPITSQVSIAEIIGQEDYDIGRFRNFTAAL